MDRERIEYILWEIQRLRGLLGQMIERRNRWVQEFEKMKQETNLFADKSIVDLKYLIKEDDEDLAAFQFCVMNYFYITEKYIDGWNRDLRKYEETVVEYFLSGNNI